MLGKWCEPDGNRMKTLKDISLSYAEKCVWALLALCYGGAFLASVVFIGLLKGDPRGAVLGAIFVQTAALVGLVGAGVLIFQKRLWLRGTVVLVAGLLATFFATFSVRLMAWLFG